MVEVFPVNLLQAVVDRFVFLYDGKHQHPCQDDEDQNPTTSVVQIRIAFNSEDFRRVKVPEESGACEKLWSVNRGRARHSVQVQEGEKDKVESELEVVVPAIKRPLFQGDCDTEGML